MWDTLSTNKTWLLLDNYKIRSYITAVIVSSHRNNKVHWSDLQMLNCRIGDRLPQELWILFIWNCKIIFMTFPFSCILCSRWRWKICKIKTKKQHTRANTKERSLALTLKINGVWSQTSPTPLPNSISLFQHLKWQRVATQSLCSVYMNWKIFCPIPEMQYVWWLKLSLWPLGSFCVRGFIFMCSLVSAWCGTSFMMDSRPFACSVSHSDSSQNNLER